MEEQRVDSVIEWHGSWWSHVVVYSMAMGSHLRSYSLMNICKHIPEKTRVMHWYLAFLGLA